IFIAGICEGMGSLSVRAGAGIYRGPDPSWKRSHNHALHVPGPALSRNRAACFALWVAIYDFPLDKPIMVVSDSQFLVYALTHNALHNAKLGWTCANGDLLKAIVARIQQRGGPTHLSYVR
ncbi:hypothetical protein BDP27DRAFT_1169658, partial [Rhodocollybia butyracea]